MYFVMEHQSDPEDNRPYAMGFTRSNRCKGYETLEEAKKVLEKIQHNHEIETEAENEYEEKLALAKGEEYRGVSYITTYSIYTLTPITQSAI